MFAWIRCFIFLIIISPTGTGLSAAVAEKIPEQPSVSHDPLTASWIFSGTVANENGERYGYLFEMQRQNSNFYAKAALIDEETNKLVFFLRKKRTNRAYRCT